MFLSPNEKLFRKYFVAYGIKLSDRDVKRITQDLKSKRKAKVRARDLLTEPHPNSAVSDTTYHSKSGKSHTVIGKFWTETDFDVVIEKNIDAGGSSQAERIGYEEMASSGIEYQCGDNKDQILSGQTHVLRDDPKIKLLDCIVKYYERNLE